MSQRIAVVDEDRVVAGLPRPPRDAREDRRAPADFGEAFDSTVEHRADQAFVHEIGARRETAFREQLRHAGGRAGSTRRSIAFSP